MKEPSTHDGFAQVDVGVSLILAVYTVVGIFRGIWNQLTWEAFSALIVIAVFLLTKAGILITNASRRARRIRALRRSDPKAIVKALLNNRWRLYFNPGMFTSKDIEFGPNQQVQLSANNNERTWRYDRDVLEIVQSTGLVHNRFKWNPDKLQFDSTNDADVVAVQTGAFRGQTLIPYSELK